MNFATRFFSAMVIFSSLCVMASDVEAASWFSKASPYNKEATVSCTCMHGTIQRVCPKHHECMGLPAHHHEKNINIAGLPAFCETEKGSFELLFDTNGPTCRQMKKIAREERREQRKAERKARKEQREAERYSRKYGFGFISDTFNKRMDRNARKVEREVRRDVRESINKRVDKIFGF